MKNPRVSAIAAIGKNRELGKAGKLFWHIPGDLPRFKKLTSGHPIITGRKTFEFIGRPLPNRTNIVVTRDFSYTIDGAIVAHSIEEAIKKAKEKDAEEIFVIGGGQIYAQALPFTNRLYLTVVDREAEADTFFPDYSEFKKIVFEEKREENGLKFKYVTLEK